MNNNIAPMPTQNPWVWVGMGMGMGTQCRALHYILANKQQGLEPSAGHILNPLKAKPKVQREKEHPTFFLAQNGPSDLTIEVLLVFGLFLMERNQRPLDHRGWVSVPA
jgi:hypothetical protein